MSLFSPTALLSLLSCLRTFRVLKQVHACLLTSGLFVHPLFAGKLLLCCTDSLKDTLPYSWQIFSSFSNPDSFMWNTLLRGNANSGRPLHALDTFVEMKRKGAQDLHLDSFSFAFVVRAAADLKCIRIGSQLHCQALVHGFRSHVFVGTTLINMYGECDCSDHAAKAFEEILQPNVVSWNALITALCRCGDVYKAKEVFNAMPIRDLTSWNIILVGCAKLGEIDLARKVFEEMPFKDDVTWSSMIHGFSTNGRFNDTFILFRQLMRDEINPNEVSLTAMLSSCAQAAALDLGRSLHSLIVKLGFSQTLSVNNALIDGYSKSGKVEMARSIFTEMADEKDVITWTSLLAGMAMCGHGKDVIELFQTMENSGVKPDSVSFIQLLYGCSHAGMVKEGLQYFEKMKQVYKIEPHFEHYGCIVDLYGRAGELNKAYKFITEMPIAPNAVIWRILLGACRVHGNLAMAEKIKSKLLEMESAEPGDAVLLSNIYAASKKWNDARSARRLSSNKIPGWSAIMVDNEMCTFFAGAKKDGRMSEACEKLKEIMARLKAEGGYVPQVGEVLFDVEEEEKEDPLSKHSEKLAVAYGMSRMRSGSSLRIVKNLRICGDCHAVMKMISQVYEMEIVVRDRSRFHVFANGSCACNDFW